jgi:hypothetical protein
MAQISRNLLWLMSKITNSPIPPSSSTARNVLGAVPIRSLRDLVPRALGTKEAFRPAKKSTADGTRSKLFSPILTFSYMSLIRMDRQRDGQTSNLISSKMKLSRPAGRQRTCATDAQARIENHTFLLYCGLSTGSRANQETERSVVPSVVRSLFCGRCRSQVEVSACALSPPPH